jgi:hypothetical protein
MMRELSRRSLLAKMAFALGLAAADACAQEESKEADKITQADAHYQSQPKGQQRCEICLQFKPPDHCKIVQGPITPQGWCQFFAGREGAR